MNYKINNNKKGFTMIEMLVSTAIFSIVITMIMGTIVTITDASRKARTLTEVMNNLNFSFESMTRTLKTGTNISVSGNPANAISAKDQNGRTITYRFSSDPNQHGITKEIDDPSGLTSSDEEPIVSDNLKLSSWYINEYYSGSNADDPIQTDGGKQPRVFFSIKGRVETAKGIASEFTLQSSVSQRRLELGTN